MYFDYIRYVVIGILATFAFTGIVTYYENLITTEMNKAFAYVLPTNSYEYQATNPSVQEYGTFDFIIVGGGSAGSVIANRLSEIFYWKILLIEAGGEETKFSDIPGMMAYLQGSELNWGYYSTPQTTACLGMVGHQCAYPRGRVLGGSSVINALMYVRGNRLDYDTWGRDCPGWMYADVLPYFIKSENSHIAGDPGYHGFKGLWNVEYHKPYSPQFDAYIQANIELGRKVVDYNGKQQLGVARTQVSNIYGRRDSTGKAFLKPARSRKNLKVMSKSLVTKILIKDGEAYGVQFVHNKQNYIARAQKEVIVSSGSINSPQLLMLSGIGPQDELTKYNISVVSNLSVGENLHDHPTFFGLFHVTNYSEPILSFRENVENFLNDYGPFSIAGNSQGIGFFRTPLTNVTGYPPDFPDIEMIFIPANSTTDFQQRSFNYDNETYNAIFGQIYPPRTFATYILLMHPTARGRLTLQSASPFVYPLIDSQFLGNDFDTETMYAGVQLFLEMVQTPAFRKLNTTLLDARHPACSGFVYLSKDYWICYIRHMTANMYHPMGTCRMGPDPKNGSVVDHRNRVYGVKRLRVADASIIPYFLTGHPNAPCVMIGEKVSDLIKQDHNII